MRFEYCSGRYQRPDPRKDAFEFGRHCNDLL
jgi:hypothetical protein